MNHLSQAEASPIRRSGKSPARRRHIRRKILQIIGVLFIALLAARLALPYYLRDYVNRTLSKIPNYSGHVDAVHVALIRGAYTLRGVKLEKTNGKAKLPFFSAPEVDFSIEWRQLLRGALVGEIEFFRPQLNFVFADSKARSQTTIDDSFQSRVQELFPFRINRFAATDGQVQLSAPDRSPPVDVKLVEVQFEATNITNSRQLSKSLNAHFVGEGKLEAQGPLTLQADFDPYATIPTFNLDLTLKDFDLTRINDVFRAEGAFDVEHGKLDLFSELASNSEGFHGYVKPILREVSILSLKRDSKNPFNLAWQSVVAGLVELFTNHKEEQFAARTEISGTFDKPESSTWQTIGTVAGNAFIEALKPQLDHSVAPRKNR